MSGALGGCDYFVSTDGWVQRAQAEMARGKYPAAALDLKKALNKTPDHAGALATSARLSLKTGDAETAQHQWELALKAGAQRSDLFDLQCEIMLARGRYDELIAALQDDKVLSAARRYSLLAAAQMGKKQFDDAAQTVDAGLRSAPDSAELLVQRARLLAAQRGFDQALQVLAAALKADPQSAAVWQLRGQVLMQQGSYEEAVAALKKGRETGLVQLDLPRYAELLDALANAQLDQRDAPGAAETIQEFDTRFPKAPADRFLHARMALLRQDYMTAVNDLKMVIGTAPGFAPARLLLGAALLYSGQPKNAEVELSGLVGKDPSNLEARKLLAQVELALHRPDEARRVLAETPQGTADSQVDWLTGIAFLQSGQGGAGIGYLERSVAAEPKGVEGRLKLARAYISSGLPQKAVAVLEGLEPAARTAESQALLVLASAAGKQPALAKQSIADLVARHPADDELLATAGNYLETLGDPVTAKSYLDRSLAVNPKDVDALMGMAQLHIRESRFDEAESRLKSVLQIDSKYQPVYWELAALSERRGDRQGSEKLLEQSIAADPSAVRSRLLLAQIALAAGDAKRAQSLIGQAVGVAPDRAGVLNAGGEILLRGGLPDQALADFNDAVSAGSPEAQINVARALVALGRNEEARHTLSSLADKSAQKQRAQLLLIELDVREHDLGDARRRIGKLREEGLPTYAADELEGKLDMVAGQYAGADKLFTASLAKQPSSSLVVEAYRARLASSAPHPQEVLLHWLENAPDDRGVRMLLAEYYLNAGAGQEAIGQYERLVSGVSQPEAVVLNNLAWLYTESGDPRSVDTARRAYEAAPANTQVADTYGWALVRAGKTADGIAMLDKAATLDPKAPGVQYHLAAAYAGTGDKQHAAGLLTPLLQSPDMFAERAQAEALLRKVQLP
jgi:putative PEP-CTERM system TPR-repeat lipoprotein